MNTLQKRKHSDYIHNPLLSSVQQQMKYVNFSAKTILIFAQFSVLKAETAARTVNSVLNHPIASHLSIHMLYFLTMKSSIKLKRIMKMVLHAIP